MRLASIVTHRILERTLHPPVTRGVCLFEYRLHLISTHYELDLSFLHEGAHPHGSLKCSRSRLTVSGRKAAATGV
jgi:hypothetical protein